MISLTGHLLHHLICAPGRRRVIYYNLKPETGDWSTLYSSMAFGVTAKGWTKVFPLASDLSVYASRVK
jgi:hypothetical protein